MDNRFHFRQHVRSIPVASVEKRVGEEGGGCLVLLRWMRKRSGIEISDCTVAGPLNKYCSTQKTGQFVTEIQSHGHFLMFSFI